MVRLRLLAPALVATAALLCGCESPRHAADRQLPLDRWARAEGYQRIDRDGQTWYCRPDVVLGSRVREEVCYTAAQVENKQRDSEEFFRSVQGAVGPAASPNSPGANRPGP